MTAGAHDAGGGFGRSAGTNAIRGILVIAAAILVGLLLMFRGISDPAESSAGGTTTTAAETGDDEGPGSTTGPDNPDEGTDGDTDGGGEPTDPTQTTTTLPAPRDPSEVKVLVLNGTDPRVQGLAGRGTDVLKTLNYVTLNPKNADVNGPSVVYFGPGFEAEAHAVAQAFGADPAQVVSPFDPTASPIADTQGADVIVRIGSDEVIRV